MEIVITSAHRSAIGSFMGGLSTVPAHQISATLIERALQRNKVDSTEISEVIIGQVLSGGCGQNTARQAALVAKLPVEVPAWTVNKVCGSGLTSVMLACDSLILGRANIVLAGGHENMSLAPHFSYLRTGQKMGKLGMEDLMLRDGLIDASSGLHMGVTAENIAQRFNISRQDQDQFSTLSHNKAETADAMAKFKAEIVPITVKTKSGDVVFDRDEFIRKGVILETLAKLKPAFKEGGTVTAGNSSGINDGAAMLMLMTSQEAQRRNLNILARIASYATVGVDPEIMGVGPIPAAHKALQLAGWKVEDLDLIEANEAFAVQAIHVNREMGWDIGRVNVNGGSISLGHPIGASGARVLVSLLHEMQKREVKKGIATLCVGGGMGVAMCVER